MKLLKLIKLMKIRKRLKFITIFQKFQITFFLTIVIQYSISENTTVNLFKC